MDFKNMTVDQIIDYFKEQQDSDEKFSLTELRAAADACSVKDNVANDDAITIFYSGGEDEIANQLAQSGDKNIRIIRHTDLFKFQAYKDKDYSFEKWVEKAIRDENENMTSEEVQSRLIEELYGVSEAGTGTNVIGKGFWSQGSARFAKETKGNVFALITEANENKIFARDEFKQLLNGDKRINNFTKQELEKKVKNVNELNKIPAMFKYLQKKENKDFKNIPVYVDKDRNKIGVKLGDIDILNKYGINKINPSVFNIIPSDSKYAQKISHSVYHKSRKEKSLSENQQAKKKLKVKYKKKSNKRNDKKNDAKKITSKRYQKNFNYFYR
jgi:hypothetical protein